MNAIVTTALVFVAGAFAAGSAEAQHAQVDDVRVYFCHNLERLTVRVLPGHVEVMTLERKTTLAEVAASSPVRYSNGTATLSGVEEYVRFEESGSSYGVAVRPPKRHGRRPSSEALSSAPRATIRSGRSRSIQALRWRWQPAAEPRAS